MRKIENEDKNNDILLPSMMKKEPRGVHPYPEHDPSKYDNEMDYVYIDFKNNFKDWTQGNSMIGNISNLLHIEPKAFVDGE